MFLILSEKQKANKFKKVLEWLKENKLFVKSRFADGICQMLRRKYKNVHKGVFVLIVRNI